jgi:hypothetical protein
MPFFNRRPIKHSIKRQSRKFSFVFYQALYGPFVFFKAIYRQLILLGIMLVWGAGIFSYFEHMPTLSALLASVSTLTTLGFYTPNNGNLLTINSWEAIFLIIMIVFCRFSGVNIAKQR